jgi:hypothetical protein
MFYLIMILAIYSLSFFVRNSSGPFDIFSKLRSKLLKSSKLGVFFYELLSCPFCVGFHCGYVIYTLQCIDFKFSLFILWGLAGSTVVAFFDSLFNKLSPP